MGVGLGWGNNVQVHVNLNTCTHPSCFALGSFPLHLHTYVMLRSGTFSCTFTHPSCYALGSSLALAHIRHATLWDLLLHLHTYVTLRSGIFSCTCTHTYVMLACHALSCYIYIDIFTLPLEVQLSNRCTSTYQTFANHGWERPRERTIYYSTKPFLNSIQVFHAHAPMICHIWCIHKFMNAKVSFGHLIYTPGKIVKTIVSLQIYVKLNNKEPKTACIWLFQAHSKTNEPK